MQPLGGLGSEVGPPDRLFWTPVSPLPVFIPWLALLALLAAKPNRHKAAWMVLVPVACGFGVSALVNGLFSGQIPSEPMDALRQAIESCAFALAALWLLAAWLERKHLFLVFLGAAAVLAVAAGLRQVLAATVDKDWEMFLVAMMATGAAGLACALALVLAGWRAKRQYRPIVFSISVFAWLVIACTVILAPFFLVALATGGSGEGALAAMTVALLSLTLGTYAVLLPFLLMSFWSGFYRERLKGLLHLETVSPPVVGLAETAAPPPLPVPSSNA